jgi:anamorsin
MYIVGSAGGESPALSALEGLLERASVLLKPGCACHVAIAGNSRLEAGDPAKLACMVAGLVDVTVETVQVPVAHVVVTSQKMTAAQAAAPAKTSLRRLAGAPAPSSSGWGGSAAASPGRIDEDALLQDDVVGSAPSDGCATKRRACKNCSCGRAEREAAEDAAPAVKVETSPAPAAEFKSACGNCAKGDAFRCASCPHRGKPAFKSGVGSALMLDLSSGDALGAPVETE